MAEGAQFFTATPKAEASPEAPAPKPEWGPPGPSGYIHSPELSGRGRLWHHSIYSGHYVVGICLFVFSSPITGWIGAAGALMCMLAAIYQRLGVIADVMVQLYEREIRKP